MTELRLEHSPEEAREVVKAAFRRTEGISSFEESSHQIVGKTGVSFPRVLWSYGERVYVDFSDPTDDGTVPIEVWAEKTVWMNIGADPEKFKRRFLEALEDTRGRSIGELQDDPAVMETTTPESPSTIKTIGYILLTGVGTLVWMLVVGGTLTGMNAFETGGLPVFLVFLVVTLVPGILIWTRIYPKRSGESTPE